MISTGPSVMHLAEFVNGTAYKPDDFGASGTPVVRIKQLLDDTAEWDLAPVPPRPVWINDGDLVFSWSATLAVRFWNRGQALLNQHLFRVDVHPDVDRRWFAYILEEGTRRLAPLMHGSAMTHITHDMLRSLTVTLPSIDTQRSLADYLDRETTRIDALIAAKRRMVELLTERASALKARWYAQLAADTGTVSLRRTLTSLEQGSSPQCYSHAADDREWGVLKTSSVSSGVFIPTENKLLPGPDLPDLRWIVHDNDVLVVRGSGSRPAVGQAAVAIVGKRKLLLSDLLYRVRLRNSLPPFIVMALQSPQVRQQIVRSIRSDSGQTLKIRGDDLKELLVPALQSSKQEEAAYKLCTDLDRVLNVSRSLEPSIALLQERRQALITAAVTGQLDIPGAV